MAQQNDGWPLGLQPLHVRVRLMENRVLTEANAFNTLIAVSPSVSSRSSSDLDTVSTTSFLHEKSITLGNLIGLPRELEVSSARIDVQDVQSRRSHHKNSRPRVWCCLSSATGSHPLDHPSASQSLGHFLEVERAAARNRSQNLFINFMYEEFTANPSIVGNNPLFSGGQVLPPQAENPSNKLHRRPAEISCSWLTLFPGLCGQTSDHS
ncbi:uncharacterized protein At3g17950-like [Nymphaea colorata]|nr:uncharacterized protein At3g17950-like [Nymphaea colorata]XP_031501550.1 uncharacterized protein At3g17950-like [Nymphaea colorata]